MAIKAYLICPVRQATDEQREEMEDYVRKLEEAGTHEFHLPHRDVDQSNDDGGVRICNEHAWAMMECEEIHVWLDRPTTKDDYYRTCERCGQPNSWCTGDAVIPCKCKPGMSIGSHFDLGMAFMLNALISDDRIEWHGEPYKFVIANPPLPETSEKSFINVLRSLVDV